MNYVSPIRLRKTLSETQDGKQWIILDNIFVNIRWKRYIVYDITHNVKERHVQLSKIRPRSTVSEKLPINANFHDASTY